MSGSTPPPDVAGEPQRGRTGWRWPLVVVLALACLTVLVLMPWTPVETEPDLTETGTTAEPTVEPSTPASPVAQPGSDAVFDATTAPALFVTAADLVAGVPAAEPGVDAQITAGQLPWGLPAGSTIDPAECTIAATVVATPPPWYDALMWGNEALAFEQEVVLLPDPATAREAFRSLVTTVDACPEYSQVNLGVDGGTWVTEPAIEGQGVYPSIVQEVTQSAEGTEVPGYRGHLLVGNTVVTWTAEALEAGDREAALATLGDPTTLSALVQDRAQSAVRSLG
ncbi:sensor domain-containing protein [Cellulomonas fengjieae]|uniref:Sensor domain-containing protein n=1 Tax=Cellulomonas fengjieae TaxID=2819978 RepID=A0ABS3SH37_9CELL|nr:sensor domain-containing protein [Cellulomonas fengjieae]MBO3084824.1 sensor domain-containing protein [Cellulomonas fengjieae]QVI66860.1 sensor domain-containing protein [Cellulomonas fengjieae]